VGGVGYLKHISLAQKHKHFYLLSCIPGTRFLILLLPRGARAFAEED